MRGIFTAATAAVCAIVLFWVAFFGVADASDAAAAAAHLSDGAFAIMNGLDARGVSKSDPAYGAVAIFAGDAQSLSSSVASGNRAAAAGAFATLASDRAAIDTAIAANPAVLNSTDWSRIKSEMAALSKQLGTSDAPPPHVASAPPPSAVSATHSAAGTAPVASGSASSVIAPTAASGSAAAGASSIASAPGSFAGSSSSSPPQVVIESRNAEGGSIHLKGYLEVRGLRRGGIYTGSHEVRDFKVGAVAGEQRLNFDIGVENPPSNAVIRVYDVDGRMAEASIVGADALASSAGAMSSAGAPFPSSASPDGVGAAGVAPEIPPLSSSAGGPSTRAPSVEDGVEVFRNKTGDDNSSGSANLAEIPSHGAPRPSPSKRHTIGSHLANVQIVISSATQIAVSPRTFELTGQIIGHGVSRAGIYVDSRLVKPITVEFGEDATTFDVKFVSNGAEARVRAFGIADQFVESSIDLSTAVASADPSMSGGDTSMSAGGLPGSMYGNPMVGGGDDGILVQIQAVGPITRNLYVVSGVISGRSLSGAGLYQNGMLVQKIPLGGGGLGGVLGALIPGTSRNVNFDVRFNPQAGPATIRAFDSSGGYNEQPIVVAGGMNPYGGANPFGINPYNTNPYGSYGANPYGNPYGTNPYGANPYGGYGGTRTNPYAGGAFGAPPISPLMPPTNPFGPPATSSW